MKKMKSNQLFDHICVNVNKLSWLKPIFIRVEANLCVSQTNLKAHRFLAHFSTILLPVLNYIKLLVKKVI